MIDANEENIRALQLSADLNELLVNANILLIEVPAICCPKLPAPVCIHLKLNLPYK